MAKILFYEDKYYLFSNFSAHAVKFEGKLYPTAEHAYQAAKFELNRIKEKIRAAKSPGESKYLSNVVFANKKKNNWSEIKLKVMYKIVKAKVAQHQEVKDILLDTGESELVENSPTDFFWGGGKDGTGQNQMGKILMKIRDELLQK